MDTPQGVSKLPRYGHQPENGKVGESLEGLDAKAPQGREVGRFALKALE